MGLLRFFGALKQAWALTVHDSMTQQLAEDKARGLDDVQAGAVLVLRMWQIPVTDDTLARATYLSGNLGNMVIGFLMFSKRIGLEKEIKNSLLTDSFPDRHGCLYFTSVPLTTFARKPMNRIWNRQNVSQGEATDAAFAAYYATLVAPVAMDAWLMLEELKELGFCPEIDNRNHAKEGLLNARGFLDNARNPDPEFCTLLRKGMQFLSKKE